MFCYSEKQKIHISQSLGRLSYTWTQHWKTQTDTKHTHTQNSKCVYSCFSIDISFSAEKDLNTSSRDGSNAYLEINSYICCFGGILCVRWWTLFTVYRLFPIVPEPVPHLLLPEVCSPMPIFIPHNVESSFHSMRPLHVHVL